MRSNHIEFTDLFCGAGGNSEGIAELAKEMNGGVEVTMAINHWPLAIETHSANHPNTDHDCADVSQVDPRRYPTTDFLIASPECTNQSNANGKKKDGDLFTPIDAAEERSRATMWDVPRFAERHHYRGIIVENVVEARKWVMFDAWLMAMHALGYLHECVYFNSQHAHPTPQSRDRMYVIFWKKGNRKPDLNIRPRGWCERCAKETETYQAWKKSGQRYGKYKKQYDYRCPDCNSIVEPYYHAAFNCIDWSIKGTPIGEKELSPNTIRRIQYGLDKYPDNTPLILNGERDARDGKKVRSILETAFTQTTRATSAVVVNKKPWIVPDEKRSIVSPDAFNSFLTYYYGGSDQASHITEPTRTLPTKDRVALIQNRATLEDCLYRMLVPFEVKIGMAFRADYKICGTGKEQVKQAGNAVNPPVAKMLVKRMIETLR